MSRREERTYISTESLTHMRWRHSIAVCTSLNLLCLCSIFCTCSLDTVAAVLRILQAFQYLKTEQLQDVKDKDVALPLKKPSSNRSLTGSRNLAPVHVELATS
ncbi:uncharacterized protein LOC125531715 [Triticum urartu]|uniref:uncharacterized protein LOC125531715 n=1 Tax=Triticum urartu TaxID=4572 RepID=UPI00204317C5|nr:uncharacterized protein LOC125531715 [Triticum urartu]XP_048551976.1 uncharacterized protein LOC125531715 [Triticum urartu]